MKNISFLNLPKVVHNNMTNSASIVLIITVIASLAILAAVMIMWQEEYKKNKQKDVEIRRLSKSRKIRSFGSSTNGSTILQCPTGKGIRLLNTSITLPNGDMCNNETTSQVYPFTQLSQYVNGSSNVRLGPNDWENVVTDPCPSHSEKNIHGSYICE